MTDDEDQTFKTMVLNKSIIYIPWTQVCPHSHPHHATGIKNMCKPHPHKLTGEVKLV